MELMQLERVWK